MFVLFRSNLENDNEIYSLAQYEASQAKIKTEDNNKCNNKENQNNNNNKNNNNNNLKVEQIATNDVETLIATNATLSTTATTTTTTTDTATKPILNANNNNNNNNNKNHNINIEKKLLNKVIETKTTTATSTPTTETIAKTELLSEINQTPQPPQSPLSKAVTTASAAAAPTIEPQIKTITSKLLLEHKTTFNLNKTKLSSPPRPKSVTASVFRAVPGILPNILIKQQNLNNKNNSTDNTTSNNKNTTTTTTNNNNKKIINTNTNGFKNSLELPTNVSTRAQSVTASVFTPISRITKQQQQQLKNNKHILRTTTTSTAAILVGQSQKQHEQQQRQRQQKQQQQQQQQLQRGDMNKGFLTFADDASNELTMLKEEPDDLAHLAPSTTVVDACMPLDETTPLFGEMLVGLMDSYGSLLPDDINSLDSTTSSTSDSATAVIKTATTSASASASASTTTSAIERVTTSTRKANCNNSNYNNNNVSETSDATTTAGAAGAATTTTRTTLSSHNGSNNGKSNVAHIDPFINYREESNDTNCSQHLLSPSVTSTSPEASSLPSLCSPNSLSQEDEFAFMTMNVDDDIDFTMRAPYIPMNEHDDLPLLTADDIMWCNSNAFSTDDMHMQKDIADVMQQQFQQLQQMHAACENPHLRNNIMDFTNTQQQQQQQNPNQNQQQQQHMQQQQQQQLQQHLSNNFSNSLCSSPASTVSSLSPSPVSNMQQQQQQQQQHQDATNTTTVFGTDSSELAALLCGTGNGTLTILGNNCNDEPEGNCSGIVGSGGNNVGTSENIIHFRQQIIDGQQLQRQQQQQQLLGVGGLSVICKKEKFNASALTSNLCDSIEDAFDNVYGKDSTNLDCWNEFLPLNVGETTTATATGSPNLQQQHLDLEYQTENCKQQQHQQQQQQQQELLLNAVPLITIQNNKNVLLQQQQQQHLAEERTKILNCNTITKVVNNNNNNNNIINKLIVNDEMLSSASAAVTATATAPTALTNSRNNTKLATIKLLNGAMVPTIATTTATATAGTGTGAGTLRVVDGKLQQQNSQTVTKTTIIQTVAAPQQHGSKRHLNPNSVQFETKRLKSGASNITGTIELQATPQLLQQLIGQQQQQQQQQQKQQQLQQKQLPLTIKIEQKQQQQLQLQRKISNQQPQQQQQSDSVLKNLLISGCDVSAGYCLIRPKKLAAKA